MTNKNTKTIIDDKTIKTFTKLIINQYYLSN